MLPAEVVRDLSVIAELVNARSSGRISQPFIDDVRVRFGMTYAGEVTDEEVAEIGRLAARFSRVFAADVATIANFANAEISGLSFSPQIVNHGERFGWHIHYFGDEFGLADRIRSAGGMSLMSLIIHGEAARLKVCAASDCGKVFVDTTRNLSKTYCDPRTCGNRAHVAAFRARA